MATRVIPLGKAIVLETGTHGLEHPVRVTHAIALPHTAALTLGQLKTKALETEGAHVNAPNAYLYCVKFADGSPELHTEESLARAHRSFMLRD